jgi:hypothetical protein
MDSPGCPCNLWVEQGSSAMPVLDATPLDRDPQGTAMLRGILFAEVPAAGRGRPRGEASMKVAAIAAERRRAVIAALQPSAIEPSRGAEVWLDPSPA